MRGVGLVYFRVTVFELDSSFRECFCLVLDGVNKRSSGRVVNMVYVAGVI